MVQGVVIEDGKIVVVDPATGEVVGRVPVSSAEEVGAVIARAKAAQLAWAERSLAERGALLKEACKKLAESQEELAKTIVKEMGKVLAEAIEEVGGAVAKDDFIDLVVEANMPIAMNEGKSIVIRQPHGVVSICAPWNFPADELLLLAIPALIAGNTVVVKPSEVAPMTGAKVMEALMAVLPSGVANLVQGDGVVGGALVQHPDVAMCTMTGSSATGKKIMESCCNTLKRLVLELGGKDPMVVFADADLDKAAEDAVAFSLMNCGQVCCSIERIYIEDGAKEVFEKKVVEKAKSWKVGNGFHAESKVGPLVSEMQRAMVAKHVDSAVSGGAKLLYKSDFPEGSGNFYPVTVLSNLKQEMEIQKEETFGPVVAIASFDGSESSAITLANDTPYGLAACVYSKDAAKARRVSRQIRAGQVGINSYPLAVAPLSCPWVGHKGSGFGYHSGPDGWRQFSMPQSLVSEEPLVEDTA